MPVDLNSEESQEWLELCRKEHQEYYNFLGRNKLTKYKVSDFSNLKRNIGFAVFGSPSQEPVYENEFLGYNKKQRKLIEKIFNLMKKYKTHHIDKENIFASFVFVSAKMQKYHVRVGVIRVPKFDTSSEKGKDIFIDSTPRVYKGWQDYLDNNKLPECLMCYPKNGMYWSESGKLQLDSCISPSGRIGSKVLKSLDITSTVAQFAGAGVGLAAIFTPIGLPVLIGDPDPRN
ncbi:hypothetical protein C0J52_03383 [Blattella germanica]|nr:hypothetical protein C0J52_03383 [Blattella germanica]